MKAKLPKKLQKGDILGIIAPASPFERKKFEKGIEEVKKGFFEVVFGSHLYDEVGYLAGLDADRAKDLIGFFKDPQINGIFCARGGYGTLRLLEILDYEVILKNSTIICGYSDITALLLAIWKKTNMITFHGPMITSFSKMSATEQKAFWHFWKEGQFEIKGQNWKIIQEGSAEGTLIGGNLTVLCSLLGTPYFPDTKNAILFLEDSGEALYRIDRLLTQLKLVGVLDSVSAVLLGNFSAGPTPEELRSLILDLFAGMKYPIVTNFSVGHEGENHIMPIGARVRLNTKTKRLWAESAVLQ